MPQRRRHPHPKRGRGQGGRCQVAKVVHRWSWKNLDGGTSLLLVHDDDSVVVWVQSRCQCGALLQPVSAEDDLRPMHPTCWECRAAGRNYAPSPSFVDAVREACLRVPPHGRFGPDRVFVASLHPEVAKSFPGLSLDAFKLRLLDASRRQLLVLARADMPGAMDRELVAASEIRYLTATFHFVLA